MSSSVSTSVDLSRDVEKGRSDATTKLPTKSVLRHPTRSLTARIRGNARSRSPPPARIRRDIKPRKGHVFELNESEIFEVTQHHVEYTYSETTLKGLAKFDDMRDYGLSEEAEKDLVKIEVKNLLAEVVNEAPFLFSSNGLLSTTDSATFEDVSNIVDQILTNFEIIKHDNARVSLQHCSDEKETTLDDFKRSRRKLIGRYKQDRMHVHGCEPKVLQPPERNQKLYFALVDYMTSTVGRLIMRTATSHYWAKQTLSVLAQWRTKLKVLSYDPTHYANRSLDNGSDDISNLNAGYESAKAFFLKIRLAPDANEHKDVEALENETDVSSRYYNEKTFFRRDLVWLFTYAARPLLNPDDSSACASCFEACTLVYKTGLDGIPTVLSNTRDGYISASSDSVRVNCSYTALELLLRNTKAVPSDAPVNPSLSNQADDIRTRIVWEWSDGEGIEHASNAKVQTSNMDHLISVVIPLGLTTTYVSNTMDNLIALAGSGTEEEDPIIQFELPPKGFQTSFTVSTADWIMKQQTLTHGRYKDQEIRPVSGSPMRLGIRAGTALFKIADECEDSLEEATNSKTTKILERFEKDKIRMNDWVISEDSVIINCKPYVRTVIGIAILIVCGGMAVPFAVGTRIRGVDPFQITTFAWLIAGFIAVLAKSRYVSEWPWHDFLRGHVVCRSVKDICDVTGIDAQMVLMNLLHEERLNNLRTKGPYNGMFARKAEGSDGFSIDKPVDASTMFASGFILLKVLNEFGEHLICMDVRKGTKGQGPDKGSVSKFLACLDIGKDAMYDTLDWKQSDNESGEDHSKEAETPSRKQLGEPRKKVKKLSIRQFRWNKVLGLYIREDQFG